MKYKFFSKLIHIILKLVENEFVKKKKFLIM